jgi:hypothetical protein
MRDPNVLPPPSAPSVEEIPIAVAAEQLGVSTEALRKRIRRGTLAGRKVGTHWYVIMPVARQADVRTASERQDEVSGQDRDALIQQLRSENEFLRSLVAELTRRVPELPAGPSAPEPGAEAPTEGGQSPVAPRKRAGWLRALWPW